MIKEKTSRNVVSKEKPYCVVLTGGIASGKTTVSDLFALIGADVIDTDVIARELVEPGEDILEEICSIFGRRYLLPDGQLDRTSMRQLIFSDPKAKMRLENIVHPAIASEVQKRLQLVKSTYCILVIPLFAESKNYSFVDRVLVVDVPENVQIMRVMARDNISKNSAKSILSAQASRKDRLAFADDVIDNSGNVEELAHQVEGLHKLYSELANCS